jgi:glycosyltransferase involved in cell wall biosynthesis
MRVVFVARAPFLSGAERSLQLLLEHLPPLGIEPAVIAATGSALKPWCQAQGIPCVECALAVRDKWHLLRWWRSVRQVRAALRGLGARLVHSNQLWSYPPAGVAGLDLGIPRVCHMRDEVTAEAVSWWCAAGVEGVLTVSRHIADQVRPAWPPEKARPIVETVMGPARLSPLPDAQERQQRRLAARRGFGLAEEGMLFGFVGQVVPVKGLSHLIEAVAGLVTRNDWQLAVAGRDPRPGAPCETECREQVRRLGLDERVRFLGFLDDVAAFYDAVDVVVVPSLEEPLARVLYEAAAQVRPVVAYATGGLPEAIRHGETGWLVPRGDIAALRDCLRDRLEQSDAIVGLAARAWVESAAAPGPYAAKVVDLYKRLL